jgi:thymidylate kinase
MAERARTNAPILVSFSGIDGAGKSTQIADLQDCLRQAGLRVRLLAFWDDIAVLRNTREFSSHAIFKGEKGVGSPAKPVNRRDKNVQSWYMTVCRCFLYFLDAISLARGTNKSRLGPFDVIIFDRYLYDELANLPLQSGLIRTYVRLLARWIPAPDIAFLLDANPVQAHQRKPEYPLQFVHSNRASYLLLSELIGGMTVIAPLMPSEVQRRVVEELRETSPEIFALTST